MPTVQPMRPLHIVTGLKPLFAVPQNPAAPKKEAGEALAAFRAELRGKDILRRLKPGPVYPFVRALCDAKQAAAKNAPKIRILTRQPPDDAQVDPYYEMIERYGLASAETELIDSNHFAGDPTDAGHQYDEVLGRLSALNAHTPVDAFFTTNRSLALRVQAEGIPAVCFGSMTTAKTDRPFFQRWSPENLAGKRVNVDAVFDLDSTAFDTLSDWVFHLAVIGLRRNPDDEKEAPANDAVQIYLRHERERLSEPMLRGPAFPLFEGLRALRAEELLEYGPRAMREGLVQYGILTTRANVSLRRVLKTLKHYGFTGDFAPVEGDGVRHMLPKGVIIGATQPLVMFDDSPKNVASIRAQGIPAGMILRGPMQPAALELPEERRDVVTAKERLFALADETGIPVNKGHVEAYVAKILAPYGGEAAVRTD